MSFITQITFDLFPAEQGGSRFLTPYCYIFRGILLDWVNQHNKPLADQLHQNIRNELPALREYSIQKENLYTTQTGVQQRRPFNERNNPRGPDGLRFFVNLLDPTVSRDFLSLLLEHNEQQVQFGPQIGVITSVKIEQINLVNLYNTARPVHELTVQFISPTNFNVMGKDYEMRFPLPTYVFGNLYKQWNLRFRGTPYEIPADFYDWVDQNVSVTSYDLDTKAWEMGKEKKFVGCVGWANYVVHVPITFPKLGTATSSPSPGELEKAQNPDADPDSEADTVKKNIQYAKFLALLITFGQYAGVGSGRTAGFGRIRLFSERTDEPESGSSFGKNRSFKPSNSH
jgi:CRISPR/Cas system endoribonuclease Cas6 (RAMP superfamily)